MGSPIPTALATPAAADSGRTYDGPIARFNDSKIQESMERAISQLAPTDAGGIFATYNSKGEARFGVVYDFGHGFSAVGVLEHTPDTGNGFEVGLRKAFKRR